jgi:hypothetical protein
LESVTKIISIREIIGQGKTEEIRYYTAPQKYLQDYAA